MRSPRSDGSAATPLLELGRALDRHRLDAGPLERDSSREAADSRFDDDRAHASNVRARPTGCLVRRRMGKDQPSQNVTL
jgi:hypothetical protein